MAMQHPACLRMLKSMLKSTVDEQGRHQVLSAGIKGIWALHHAEAIDSGGQLTPQGGQHHTYLLMSHPASSETKVLETGEELAEVPADRSGFMLESPTIAAGNVLNNTLIVQVSILDLLPYLLGMGSTTYTPVQQTLMFGSAESTKALIVQLSLCRPLG